MPLPNTQNGEAVSGASDSGQNASGLPPTGPLSVSALAQALRPGFESQADPTEQSQVQSPEGDQTAAAPPEAEAAPVEGQEQADQAGAEQEQEQEQEQGEEGEEAAQDQQEPEAEQGTESPRVKKRIGQLMGRIRELEKELQDSKERGAPESQPRGPSPLANVSDANELEDRQSKAEAALDECELLLAKLPVAPGGVEQYLRQSKIELKDENGEEDYSAERMADFLTKARHSFRQVLREIPKRREWLKNFALAHAQTVKVKPWVGDKTDDRYALMQNILQQFPGLKAAPNYEYWVACAVDGHLSTLKQTPKPKPAAASAARPANGAPRAGMPNTAAAGAAQRPAATADKAKVDAARKAVVKNGDRRALSAFFQATGAIK